MARSVRATGRLRHNPDAMEPLMSKIGAMDLGQSAVFDIGYGPMVPDQHVLRTGHVPVDVYYSEERFEIEREVFNHSWLNVGRVEEIPNPGDWLVHELAIGSTSVLVVRGKDNQVRAFHNMCAHRGVKLVWGDKGNSGQFVCPYHAWTYGSDGALRGVTARECFPNLNQEASGLKPIALDVWEGFIFINLDSKPRRTLREWLGPVVDILAGAPFGEYSLGCRLSAEMKGNWKLNVESQSEGYHVQALHRLTARDFVASRQDPFGHYFGLQSLGAHRRASSPRNVDYAPDPAKPVQTLAFGSVPHLFLREEDDAGGPFAKTDINRTKAANWGVELFQIFPNFGLDISYNGFWCTYAWPVTAETCIWEARYYFRKPSTRRERFGTEGTLAFNRDTLVEDVLCSEMQQAMMRSGGREFVQFGENEFVLRHEAAVWEAVADRLSHGSSKSKLAG
jgi:phenylpropionate dioxygenase-like ring-hydroxylating dioxygenase large terminal subunit